jgi:SAM-dependent methyltransferase
MTDKIGKSGYYDGYNLGENDDDSNFSKAMNVYKKEGLFTLIKKILTYSVFKINYTVFKINYTVFKINYTVFNRYFEVDGKRYHYLINQYNAVLGERVVEVPFIIDFLKKNKYEDKKVLEVGNVLSHYFKFKHKIVDKYEKETYVDNVDIVDFNPGEKYDIIISISTVEHIGYDEPVKEVGKSKRAIQKILDLLDNNGIALITVPLGYNPEIDSIVINKEIEFSKRYFLKRISRLNLWEETKLEEAMNYKYGSKYQFANAVAFLIYFRNS